MTSKSDEENTLNEQNLYMDLYSVVKDSLCGRINKEKIIEVNQAVIETFAQDPYNPLLLYFFSESDENYLFSHITNDVLLSIAFGTSLQLSQENLLNLALCAFGHDFGMMEYTHLFQKNKELSEYEHKIMQKHALKSAEMFKDVFPDEVLDAITDIHEQVDGNGYPQGKISQDISFLAKLTAICDVYEALTHQRNSRLKLIPYEAIKSIIKQKDIFFDGKVINKFVDFISIYPIGSLVYLNTGEIGMVIGSNYGYPTRCLVRVLLNASHEVVETTPKIYDLSKNIMVYVSTPVPFNEEQEILSVLNPRGLFPIGEETQGE